MADLSDDDRARLAAGRAARGAYGRLVAYLAARWRDVAGAEDALGEALVAALQRWPVDGVPERPEAWLLTVARRKLSDAARHDQVRARADIVAALADAHADADSHSLAPEGGFPDQRLRLMLVCAHPAIDAKTRPALILQTVLGVEAQTMASAFLLSPQAMTKRLVRAKAKIRAAGLSFEEPTPEQLGERLPPLLEAIYAAYFLGAEGAVSTGDVHDELAHEALWLAQVVAEALPDSGEALGFAALLLLCEARRPAQIDAHGRFVPLLEQDPQRWNHELIRAGHALLTRAAAQRQLGPFQLEAAIGAAHCSRAQTNQVPWDEIEALYRALVMQLGTIGPTIGWAIATAHSRDGLARGQAILAALDPDRVRDHQPYWVARWHLHRLAGELEPARAALERALGLTSHPRLHAYLRAQLG